MEKKALKGKGYKYRIGSGLFYKSEKDFKSIFERDLEAMKNNKIWASLKDELNDPMETKYIDTNFLSFIDKHIHLPATQIFASQYTDIKNNIVTKHGIYCLSCSYLNQLLWGYYADGHKGYCIEYDLDILNSQYNYNSNYTALNIIEVKYPKLMPEINKGNASNIISDYEKSLSLLIGSKPFDWIHEKEIRLIFETNGLVDIDYRAITAIYFGMKTQDEDIDTIMNAMKGRGIKYYRVHFKENNYTMDKFEIDDKYIETPRYYPMKNVVNIDEFFFSQEYLHDNYKYIDILRTAVKKVELEEPFITEIYQVCVETKGEGTFINVFAYTGIQAAPVKIFKYSIHEL